MFKTTIKTIIYSFLTILFLVFTYLLSEYILSRITNDYILDSKDYKIFIKSNGVHTDIILPLKNHTINWQELFAFEDTLSKSDDFNYIAIGWGDKGFYLDTPTWADLKVSTAFIAATALGNAAFHITFYKEILEDDLTYGVEISQKQYEKIVQGVKSSLKYENGKTINIKTTAQYGKNDSFYEAKGSYSIFHTCNTWANNILKSANLPSSKWVAFDDGILYQYRKIEKTKE